MNKHLMLASFLALGACAEWDAVEFEDEGRVCLRSEDAQLEIQVIAPDCPGDPSCSREVEATCNAEVVGSEIVVTSEHRWEKKTKGPGECVSICAELYADCDPLDVAPGTYVLRHGEHTEMVTLPVENTCAGL